MAAPSMAGEPAQSQATHNLPRWTIAVIMVVHNALLDRGVATLTKPDRLFIEDWMQVEHKFHALIIEHSL